MKNVKIKSLKLDPIFRTHWPGLRKHYNTQVCLANKLVALNTDNSLYFPFFFWNTLDLNTIGLVYH